jgi:NADH-quinone oxidoreductase subunit J
LQAELLAAVQILIYVGAVAVLIIFAIMLTSQIGTQRIKQSNEQVPAGLAVSLAFLIAILASLPYSTWRISQAELPLNNIMTIGRLLLTDFVLPFEVVSVVLLAAMIGAIVLARREGA